jgi:hypothetical protein
MFVEEREALYHFCILGSFSFLCAVCINAAHVGVCVIESMGG